MQVVTRSVVLKDRKIEPYFELRQAQKEFTPEAVVVKVLAFSIDPVMYVWLSGSKTQFRTVKEGEVFNCFGVGVVVQEGSGSFEKGSYIFGNTGTTNYF